MAKRQISYDTRAVLVDGQRQFILSGAIRYPRSTPEQWRDLMRRSRDAGLNTIETYVFWCLHERERGVYDFSGRLDLPRFLEEAQRQDLNVFLRMGPYACAEINYGGFPAWLRDVPGIRMRTLNAPFQAECQRWLESLCQKIRPYLATQGGPIILAQIENEYANIGKHYGEQGQAYLRWIIELAQSFKFDVPWCMCFGGIEGAIETINAFYGHESLETHRREHPQQPALWTENWPSWYDTWGYARHRRDPRDVAYSVARFVAGGGTGVNYYMWHGGTNFGRESMYLQTTSYDFDAPLNEYGLPTPKFHHLAKLHHALLECQAPILAGLPSVLELATDMIAFEFGDGAVRFLCNDSTSDATVDLGEREKYSIPAKCVHLFRNGQLLFDSSDISRAQVENRPHHQLVTQAPMRFECWREPLPRDWPTVAQSAVTNPAPIEQLQLTRDRSDYCWYSASIKVDAAAGGEADLVLDGMADFVSVYIDGALVATSALPLAENRVLQNNEGFRQTFHLSLAPGLHRLDLLCASLGLIKGDWMLGFVNQAMERKGIWGSVTWAGKRIENWRMQPGLLGEIYQAWSAAGELLPWKCDAIAIPGPRWYRTRFISPPGDAPVALDLHCMNKGIFWINGICGGRYWLAEAAGRNPITPPDPPIMIDSTPGPTQRLFHVPRAWLREQNVLVFFEEINGQPQDVQIHTVQSAT